MDFMDLLCDSQRAKDLLGLDSPVVGCQRDERDDEEEVTFEDDETIFTGTDDEETETQTFTYTQEYTYDGSTYTGSRPFRHLKSMSTANTALSPAFQKSTPLFDAIDQHYWTTVMNFLSTGQWDSAGRSRLPVVPLKEEARQWSVTLDKSGKVTSRRLPIHAALTNKAPLNIVEKLIALYPNGASCADSQGNLPLHVAFQNDVDPSVISYLLQAYPEAVLVKNTSNKRGRLKGLLPMECAPPRTSKETKAIAKLCKDKAREISYLSLTNGFEAASSFPPKEHAPGSPEETNEEPPSSNKPNNNNDAQEHELMEIRKELDDLRRAGSTASATSNQAPKKESEPLDGSAWMRSISSSFLGVTSMSTYTNKQIEEEDDIPLSPIVEAAASEQSLSDHESSKHSGSSSNNSEHKTNPMGNRWFLRSGKNEDMYDMDDTATKESFEVNLTTRSVASSSHHKSNKRFSFSNPFKSHRRQSSNQSSEQIDTVTVQSGSSKNNLSVSRFSLSAVKDHSDAKSASAAGSKSMGTSTGSTKFSKRSKSSLKKRIFHKRQSSGKSWFSHASGSTKKSTQASKESSESASTSHGSSQVELVAKQDGKVVHETAEQGGVFSSWGIENNTLAKMILPNASPTTADTPNEEEEEEQREPSNNNGLATAMAKRMLANVTIIAPTGSRIDIHEEQKDAEAIHSDLSLFRRTQSSAENSQRANSRSFGKSFLKRNEHNFLENSLLMGSQSQSGPPSKPEQQAENKSGGGRFGRLGRGRKQSSRDDNAESNDDSYGDTYSSGDDATSSNDSMSSHDDESLPYESDDDNEDDSADRLRSKITSSQKDRRSSRASERGDPAASPETRTAPEGSTRKSNSGKLGRRFGKRKSKKREKKKEKSRHRGVNGKKRDKSKGRGNSSMSSGEERRKTKFGLFRRKKSSDFSPDVAKSRGVVQASKGNSLLTKQLQQAAAEAQRQLSTSPQKPSSDSSLARRRFSLNNGGNSPSPQKPTSESSLARAPTRELHHNRQGSIGSSSRSSAVLPKGDWRADYTNYLARTQSVTSAEKKAAQSPPPSPPRPPRSTVPPPPPPKTASPRPQQKTSKVFPPSRHRRTSSSKSKRHASFLAEQLAALSSPNLGGGGPCAEDILDDLQSMSRPKQFLLDSAATPPPLSKVPLNGSSQSRSTCPVVSESTLDTPEEEGNVYLVRVQF